MPHRQEVINVVLAQLMQERGVIAAPEQILRTPDADTRLPDVIVDFQGLRLAIEAEFSNSANATQRAYNKAKERVDEGIAHIAAAVVYPAALRQTPFASITGRLALARLRFSIVNEVTVPETQLHLFDQETYEPSFLRGTVDDLMDALRRSYEQLVRDDTLQRAVLMVESAIAHFIEAIHLQPAAVVRMARELGVHQVPTDSGTERNNTSLSSRQRLALARIGSLILVNAMVFQEMLSRGDSRVVNLQRWRHSENLLSELRDHWHYILAEINYYPIFHISHQILLCLSEESSISRALETLVDTALKLVSCRAPLRHDLAGRIYHRLLEEAKYLGAYYTAIPSATLLLKLALRPDRFCFDWSSLENLQTTRVADLACGTGTLLTPHRASGGTVEEWAPASLSASVFSLLIVCGQYVAAMLQLCIPFLGCEKGHKCLCSKG